VLTIFGYPNVLRIDFSGSRYAKEVSLLITQTVVVLASLIVTAFVSSCSSPAQDGRGHPTSTDKPLLTGVPAGSNSRDVAFAENVIAGDQQGIDMASLVPDCSTNRAVVSLATTIVSVRQSDIQILKVLQVQWKDDSDNPPRSDGASAIVKGMVDQATMTKLQSLHGRDFDTPWIHAMIGLDQGIIEVAGAETTDGHNIDAVGLATQIVKARQTEIEQLTQVLKD
jgi:uncharacterized protein (DUF305 family)